MRTKRIEYEIGYIVKDEKLEKEIMVAAKEFVKNILDNIGSEYIIPDLEPLIMMNVSIAISDRAIEEGYEIMMKNKED